MRIAAVALLVSMTLLCGQENQPPAAKPADVASVEAILNAVYDIISGPAGKARDWDRFRSLMRPDARMAATRQRPDGTVVTRAFSVEEFIAGSTKALAEQPFYERGVANHVDRFAHIAQVFSTYESRRAPEAKPFVRGINSFELLNDGTRWWILTISWEEESPVNPLPKEFEPAK